MNRDGKEEVTNNTFAIVRKADEQARFNRLLGFRLDHVDAREGQNSFVAKPELIGNFHQGILHGGVISAVIDTAGGPRGLCLRPGQHQRSSAGGSGP